MNKGYTLVELLVTMVIISILSGISANSYNNFITDAKYAKAQAEFADLRGAVLLAQTLSEKTLQDITGETGTMTPCGLVIAAGGDLTDDLEDPNYQACLTDWRMALANISLASGVSVAEFIYDPWGAPYLLDEGGLEDCHYSILASAGKNGDFSDETLRIEIYDPANTTCDSSEEEESVGEPEDIPADLEPEEVYDYYGALNDLFPNFPAPQAPLLVECYFESDICKPDVVKCIGKKNRNGCAVKAVNFYDKIGEISG